MKCEQCQTDGDIELVAKLKTDWDDAREQVYDEWLRCKRCGATYYAELTDYFFSDDFEIATYAADPQAWQESYARARACPAPDDYQCPCPAHTQGRQGCGKLIKLDSVYYHD